MTSRSFAAFAIVALGALPLAWGSLQAQKPAADQAGAPVDFARDIQPILQNHCYECHGAEENEGEAASRPARRGVMKGGETGAIDRPGQQRAEPDRSPPARPRRRRPHAEGRRSAAGRPDRADSRLDRSRRRVAGNGADSGDASPHAAPEEPAALGLSPARRVRALPEVRQADWVRTPIDRFVLARLEKEGLTPSPEAPLETLVRRVSLDLIGLPPSPQEVDEVLADAARDGQDAAYARLVDRLLASPHYGERWARPWLDLARYADSHGLRKGSAARDVEVPRLGDRRAQSRHAVRSLHRSSRLPATCCRTPRRTSGSRAGSIATR